MSFPHYYECRDLFQMHQHIYHVSKSLMLMAVVVVCSAPFSAFRTCMGSLRNSSFNLVWIWQRGLCLVQISTTPLSCIGFQGLWSIIPISLAETYLRNSGYVGRSHILLGTVLPLLSVLGLIFHEAYDTNHKQFLRRIMEIVSRGRHHFLSLLHIVV